MTNKSLLDLVAKENEINLRMRVVSLTKESLRVEHTPLFESKQNDKQKESRDVVNVDEKQPLPYGILELRFAGIETPISDRAMKELSKKKTGLFRTTGLDILVSNKLT